MPTMPQHLTMHIADCPPGCSGTRSCLAVDPSAEAYTINIVGDGPFSSSAARCILGTIYETRGKPVAVHGGRRAINTLRMLGVQRIQGVQLSESLSTEPVPA